MHQIARACVGKMMLNPLKRLLLSRSEKYTYRGVPMQKNPVDLAVYSRLLWNLRPKTIIEIGSFAGGSAMWFADQGSSMDFYPDVVSVDIDPPTLPKMGRGWPEIRFVKGDARCLDPSIVADCQKPFLAIEDSAHDYNTTLAVLGFFDRYVTCRDYVVVEDVHVPQVARAVRDWLAAHKRYQIDDHYQDFWGFSDHAYMRVV